MSKVGDEQYPSDSYEYESDYSSDNNNPISQLLKKSSPKKHENNNKNGQAQTLEASPGPPSLEDLAKNTIIDKDNPLASLLHHSTEHENSSVTNTPEKKLARGSNSTSNSKLLENVKSNPQNPIIVLTKSDDEDDSDEEEEGAPIGLSVRQPSFSNLHGQLIPKGQVKPLLAMEEEAEEKENTKETSKKSKNEVNEADKLLKRIQSDDNPVIVATDKSDSDDEDGAPIGLSVRQPSFSNLHGQLIPKGAAKPMLPDLNETPTEAPQPQKPKSALHNLLGNSSSSSEEDEEEDEDDDDDEGGAQIGLSVRQPSFSNLHGQLIPKGQVKPMLPDLSEENPVVVVEEEPPKTVEEAPKDQTKKSELPGKSNVRSLLNNSSSDSSSEEDEDDDDDDDGGPQIGLSVRQPSFSNLHGQLIPKGQVKPMLPDLSEENPVIVVEEEPPKKETTEKKDDSDDFESDSDKSDSDSDESDSDSDDDDNGNGSQRETIGLKARQPSFSNLHGPLIPKGQVKPILPDLNEDEREIVVEEKDEPEEDEDDQGEISLENITPEDRVKNQILSSLHQINAKRWSEIGYTAPPLKRVMTSAMMKPKNALSNSTRNYSYSNYYPKVVEITVPGNSAPTKPAKVNSSRGRRHLVVEMPKSMTKDIPEAPSVVYEETASSSSDSSSTKPADDRRAVHSAGGSRNMSSVEFLLPQGMRKADEQKPRKTATTKPNPKIVSPTPKKKGGSVRRGKIGRNTSTDASSEEAGLDEELYLELDDIKNEQGYDSEQGSSRIPKRLHDMIVHPKESVVYLALCGVSVCGYSNRTINDTLFELKKYLDRCVKHGYLEESAYVQSIIDQIKHERTELKAMMTADNTEEVERRLEEAREDLSKREQMWSQKEAALDGEKKYALEAHRLKCEEEREALTEEWQSEKMRSKFDRPSAKLMELRQTAQRLIAAKRFDEAARMGEEIERREQEEAAEAGARMNDAYKKAMERLEAKLEGEQRAIELSYNTKAAGLAHDRQKNLLPAQNRVTRIQHEREVAASQQKKAEKIMAKKRSEIKQAKELNVKKVPSVLGHKKLPLPPLKPVRFQPLDRPMTTKM